jgi:hypothetical protein
LYFRLRYTLFVEKINYFDFKMLFLHSNLYRSRFDSQIRVKKKVQNDFFFDFILLQCLTHFLEYILIFFEFGVQ